MNFQIHSFRHAEVVARQMNFIEEFNEIIDMITNLSDEEIISAHNNLGSVDIMKLPKSISVAINHIIKDKLIALNWNPESAIFQDEDYKGDKWRLDFAKGVYSIEVGFNHSGTVAWNLLKPVLASELNHVSKAIQTKIGIIITATDNLKVAGGFDSAIGTYEMYLDYLKPLNNVLTVPLIIIGLEAPETFRIQHSNPAPRKTIGEVVYI